MLYEQGKVHHVGRLDDLEDQQCSWVPGQPGPSPGRMDADVWLITYLMGKSGTSAGPAEGAQKSRFRR